MPACPITLTGVPCARVGGVKEVLEEPQLVVATDERWLEA